MDPSLPSSGTGTVWTTTAKTKRSINDLVNTFISFVGMKFIAPLGRLLNVDRNVKLISRLAAGI